MRVIVCPGCSVKIKVPAGRSGRCACPKCGQALLIKAPSPAGPMPGAIPTPATQPLPSQPLPSQPFSSQPFSSQPLPTQPFPVQPAANAYAVTPAVPGQGRAALPHAGQPRSPANATGATPLKAFLKRLGIGLGILSGVLLLLMGLGMIAEPIAIAAALTGVLSAVLLLVWGKVWLLVMAFQESVTQGLLVLLVPYYWIVYLATRKGRALQPAAVLFSAVVPLLLSLVMLALFAGRYEGAARSFRRGGSGGVRVSQARIREVEARIRQSYETTTEADVLRTVSFHTFSQIRGPIDPAKAERALVGLPGYVAGSFRFDAAQRTVMFQYHGEKKTASLYALILPPKADIMMTMTPTFIAETDLPAMNITQAKPAAASPAASPAKINISAPVTTELNTVRTVSFQTLAQGAIDAARAESVLAELSGYVAGSFRFDPEQQMITFQYRGNQAAATQYAFALQGKMLLTLRLKPIFADESPRGAQP